MAVDDQYTAEALPSQTVENIANQADIGFLADADRAGIGEKIGRDAIGHDREDRNAEGGGSIGRHFLRQD